MIRLVYIILGASGILLVILGVLFILEGESTKGTLDMILGMQFLLYLKDEK